MRLGFNQCLSILLESWLTYPLLRWSPLFVLGSGASSSAISSVEAAVNVVDGASGSNSVHYI